MNADIKFKNLKCNNRICPIGTDEQPIFSWCYENTYIRNMKQKRFEITLWDESGVIFSKLCRTDKMSFVLPNTIELKSFHKYSWQIAANVGGCEILSEPQFFETGILKEDFCRDYGARWIECYQNTENAAIIFKKTFSVNYLPESARAYIFGLGWQSVSLNGKKKSEGWFAPANTLYNRYCLYETYDITEDIISGKNIFQVLLGGGYNENYSRFGWKWEKGKRLLGLIVLTYSDGSSEYITTDESWEVFNSNITYCDIYNGEKYDANILPGKISDAVFSKEFPMGKLKANDAPNVKEYRRIKPVSRSKCAGGYIYDFGENFAGVAEIKVRAPKGYKISLQYSELIYANGKQRISTNREAQARDEYICCGKGTETYIPTFTYHGFRYVKVTGITEEVEFLELEGVFLSADVSSGSCFVCSDHLINQIHENTLRSLRSNLMTIPTDCCMRNERTPCQMDSLCVEEAHIYNSDMHGFYRKWLNDIAGIHGNPDWNGDQINLADNLIKYYDDKEYVKKYYPEFKKYILFLVKNSDNYIWRNGFGDWCHPNENTWESFHNSVEVVNTCLFWYAAQTVAKFAKLFGCKKDYEKFKCISEKIRNAFITEFVDTQTGKVNKGTQTEQSAALYFGMLDNDTAKKAAKLLVEKLRTESADLGIFGISFIGKVLSDYGETELLYNLLKECEYPSFGYQIANGATSLWEQWAYDGRMHSHNHAMFGGVDKIFYNYFAGIIAKDNSFREFAIKPKLPRNIDFAECKVDTQSGIIYVKHGKSAGGYSLNAKIPVNTKAEIYIPLENTDFEFFDGEKFICPKNYVIEDGYIKLLVGSGKYQFRTVEKAIVFEQIKKYCKE